MLHFRATVIVLILATSVSVSVASEKELWADHLLKEIPVSCRSRFQVDKDLDQFKRCVEEDVHSLQTFAETGNSDACRRDVTRCLKQLGETLKHCLAADKYQQMFLDPVKAVMGGHMFICTNNGQPFKDFNAQGQQCFADNDVGKLIRQCVEKSSEILENRFTAIFTSDETCRELVTISTCLIDATDNCEDKTARDFFKNLSLHMLNQTPCKRFTHQLYTHTPSPSSLQTSQAAQQHSLDKIIFSLAIFLSLIQFFST